MIAFLAAGIPGARWFHRLAPSFECITWNALNQLTAMSKNAVTQASYSYDAIGRRSSRIAGPATTSWVYDGEDIVRQRSTVAGVTTTMQLAHGPDIDEPMVVEGDVGSPSYLHADGLFSIVRHSAANGDVIDTLAYDPWGNLQSGAPIMYGFTGREWDGPIGMWYYRARYYSASVGRFVSEDPVGFQAGPNFFAYAINRPTRFVDPTGLDVNVCGTTAGGTAPYHAYLCITWPDGRRTCQGLIPGEYSMSGFSGGAYGALDPYDNPSECSSKPYSTDPCMDRCVLRKFKEPPPIYQAIPIAPGTENCQTYKGRILSECFAECSKNAPPPCTRNPKTGQIKCRAQ